MKRYLLALAITVAATAMSLPARATLIDRGNGLIYDTVLDITWLQDANFAQTSSFDADGLMTWQTAVDFAAGLVFQGFDDWRLSTISTTSPTTSAFDCSGGSAADCAAAGNELGFMYHHNMDGAGDNRGTQTVDGVDLMNVQSLYWSGTEFDSSNAWLFDFFFDGLSDFGKDNNLAAWAVRPGDVLAAAEPATALLVAAGLAGVGWRRRRRPRHRSFGHSVIRVI